MSPGPARHFPGARVRHIPRELLMGEPTESANGAATGIPAELVNITANFYVYETREPNKRAEIYYLRRTRFRGSPPVHITLPPLPSFR